MALTPALMKTIIFCCLNVSTTPLRQWGFRQYLPFSWTTLRDKHCQHSIAVMGVVDTFGRYQHQHRSRVVISSYSSQAKANSKVSNSLQFLWSPRTFLMYFFSNSCQNLVTETTQEQKCKYSAAHTRVQVTSLHPQSNFSKLKHTGRIFLILSKNYQKPSKIRFKFPSIISRQIESMHIL